MIMVITIEVFFCFYMLTNMQTVSSSFGMQGERMDVISGRRIQHLVREASAT